MTSHPCTVETERCIRFSPAQVAFRKNRKGSTSCYTSHISCVTAKPRFSMGSSENRVTKHCTCSRWDYSLLQAPVMGFPSPRTHINNPTLKHELHIGTGVTPLDNIMCSFALHGASPQNIPTSQRVSQHPRQCDKGKRGGWGYYWWSACLSRNTIDHASPRARRIFSAREIADGQLLLHFPRGCQYKFFPIPLTVILAWSRHRRLPIIVIHILRLAIP